MITDRFQDRSIILSDGLQMHVRDYPGPAAKPPLLCLHGLTRNSRDFAAFAERYSPEWRVLTPDFRGRGRSDYDPLPARYNPVTYARDVGELLDQLGIAKAVFVGTSLGGLVTMAVAATAPQRIAATILNDVGPELSPEGLDHIQTYLGRDARFGSWSEAAAAVARIQGSAFPHHSEEDWLAAARRNCREENGEIRFDYDKAIALPFQAAGGAPKVDLWPLFMALAQKPLLVVRGELSNLLSAEALARMHEAVPAMQSVTVPGVGHAPMLDEPEALAAIDAFLASLPNA